MQAEAKVRVKNKNKLFFLYKIHLNIFKNINKKNNLIFFFYMI